MTPPTAGGLAAPEGPYNDRPGPIAQLEERLNGIEEAVGSSPTGSTKAFSSALCQAYGVEAAPWQLHVCLQERTIQEKRDATGSV